MQLTSIIRCVLLFSLCFLSAVAAGQSISITIEPEEVPLNRPLMITITAENATIESYKGFPELEGFVKRGSTSGTQIRLENGTLTNVQTISMRYLARKEGTYRVPNFEMEVNGKTYSVQGRQVKVTPELNNGRQKNDPFGNNLFDNFLFPEDRAEVEFIEVEDDAFLAVTVDKNEVYLGEGVNVTLAFYRSETNRAPFDFYQHNQQLAEIRKQIRPTNAWEEDFNITNHYPQMVNIRGKRYIQNKLYQATFYPLTLDTIKIPAVDLQMIKYKVARNPTFMGRNKQVDYKTFTSRPVTIRVKPLPPHPLRDVVPVGDYRLQERIYEEDLETGKSTYYNFRIAGEGNIATVKKPDVSGDRGLEVSDPTEIRDISRSGNRVAGQATFSYFITPREPGIYRFDELFNWIFFNPKSAAYDTLQSELVLRVTGEPMLEESTALAETGLFYDRIAEEDNTLRSRGASKNSILWEMFGYLLILAMLCFTGYLVYKK